MLGVLARRLGDLDLAEEALQDAVAEALAHWPHEGVPRQPAGWLVTTAWRKAIDRLRREATGADRLATLARERPPEPRDDDRLALVFACCHPMLPRAAQVALTLNAACGLATEQIAAAFLVPTPTMAQRLVRAKRKLRDERRTVQPARRIRAAEAAAVSPGRRLPGLQRGLSRQRGAAAQGAGSRRAGAGPPVGCNCCRTSRRRRVSPPCWSCTRRERRPASMRSAVWCCWNSRIVVVGTGA